MLLERTGDNLSNLFFHLTQIFSHISLGRSHLFPFPQTSQSSGRLSLLLSAVRLAQRGEKQQTRSGIVPGASRRGRRRCFLGMWGSRFSSSGQTFFLLIIFCILPWKKKYFWSSNSCFLKPNGNWEALRLAK